jgi:HPt (histidine-containing phosphotransfer) domain-containing protein
MNNPTTTTQSQAKVTKSTSAQNRSHRPMPHFVGNVPERPIMPLIEIDALQQFMQGDEELLADLSTLFVQYYPDMAARLKLAIENRDCQLLRETAHQLKSRLGYFQTPVLVDFACRLEHYAKTGRFDDANASLEALFVGVRQLVDELRDLTQLPLCLSEND